MTIRRKVPVFLLLISIALLAVVAITSRVLLLDRFVQLEEREVLLNVQRAGNALSDELTDLTQSVTDYANYDRLYAYMLNHDPKFPEGEFGNLDALRANVVGIYDLNGKMAFGKAVALPNFSSIAIPEGVPEAFAASSSLLRRPGDESAISGVLLLPAGPMLVAVSPILTGARKGPVRGTLMMGRWLDQREVQRLSQKTRLSIFLRGTADTDLSQDFRTAASMLSPSKPVFVRAAGPKEIGGYLLVTDLKNRPALILKVDLPRTIYSQGRATVLYLLLWTLAAGSAFVIAMFVLLDRTVLSRLARLSSGVEAIGRLGRISARVHADGNDELTTLGKTINKTFDALESAEESLRITNIELETRVRKRTDQLAASKEKAEAADRAKSDFMANISHELRTPMNGIIGMLEMAFQTEMSPELQDYLQTARLSSNAMMRVISDILDFSKLDAGQLAFERVEFNVAGCVGAAFETLKASASQKGLALVSETARSVPATLVGDPARIEQILLNLMDNAIKFTERGQVALRVETTSAAGDEIELHFSVSDTGIGIAPQRQQEIFDCFTQVDTSSTRKYGGLGLGLTICSKLLKEMGGRIWIESKVGVGSTVHFLLRFQPAFKAESSAPNVVEEQPTSTMLN
jgi:signal transduction histidine kinase